METAAGHKGRARGDWLRDVPSSSPRNRLSLTLVMLAAGLSSRFGRLKQLEPVGPNGEAIMDYNVYDALRAGFSGVTYVVRPEILADVQRHVAAAWGDSVPVRFVCQEL